MRIGFCAFTYSESEVIVVDVSDADVLEFKRDADEPKTERMLLFVSRMLTFIDDDAEHVPMKMLFLRFTEIAITDPLEIAESDVFAHGETSIVESEEREQVRDALVDRSEQVSYDWSGIYGE